MSEEKEEPNKEEPNSREATGSELYPTEDSYSRRYNGQHLSFIPDVQARSLYDHRKV